MSKTTGSDPLSDALENGSVAPADQEGGMGQASAGQPALRVLGQYLKDLSFENPNAPLSIAQHQDTPPEISVSVNVNARPLGPTDFEVELHLEARATSQEKVAFAAEIVYAGTFRLENFPQQMLHPAVLIECPRLLFPFARRILAEATRDGGFPPLLLDPIDFAAMYQRRMQQETVGEA